MYFSFPAQYLTKLFHRRALATIHWQKLHAGGPATLKPVLRKFLLHNMLNPYTILGHSKDKIDLMPGLLHCKIRIILKQILQIVGQLALIIPGFPHGRTQAHPVIGISHVIHINQITQSFFDHKLQYLPWRRIQHHMMQHTFIVCIVDRSTISHHLIGIGPKLLFKIQNMSRKPPRGHGKQTAFLLKITNRLRIFL